MGAARTLSTRYLLETDMRIGWTSANWDRFALENGAPELAEGRVLGRPLWDFIEGEDTRSIFEDLIGRVRETAEAPAIPFRCDSPDVRRFMTMRIKPAEDANVQVLAELDREEARAYVGLLAVDSRRTGEPIRICSFCKRVETPGARWLEVEDAASALGLDEDEPLPPLDNVVCPDCKTATHAGRLRSAE